MSKKIVTLLVLGLLVLGITQLAYATEVVVNEESERSCFLDYLSPESRTKAESIIEEFHAVMTSLRAKMAEARGTGDRDARDAVHEEMGEARDSKRESIGALLPDEYKNEYMEREFQGMRKHSPEDSQLRAGGRGNGQSQQMHMQSKTNNL